MSSLISDDDVARDVLEGRVKLAKEQFAQQVRQRFNQNLEDWAEKSYPGKFKGLEADAIIMVDVDRDTFNDSNKMLFYVGASRARLNLDIMAVLSDDDCKEILERLPVKQPKITKPKRDFAAALNTVGCLTE